MFSAAPLPGETLRPILLTFALLLVVAPASPAQEADSNAVELELPPRPVPLAEIPSQVDDTSALLRDLELRLRPSATVEAVREAWGESGEAVRQRISAAQVEVGGVGNPGALGDLDQEWRARRRQLSRWNQLLSEREGRLEDALDRIELLDERWRLTLAQLGPGATNADLREAVEETRAELSSARVRAVEQVGELRRLQGRVATQSLRVADLIEDISARREALRAELFTSAAPPMWELLGEGVDPAALRADLRTALAHDRDAVEGFLDLYAGRFPFHLGLLLLFWLLARRLRGAARRLCEEDDGFELPTRVFARPVATAFLLALLASPWFYPLAPGVVEGLLGALALVPVMLLLPPLLPAGLRWLPWVLALFYLFDRLRQLAYAAPEVERWLLLLQLLLALAVVLGRLGLRRLLHPHDDPRPLRWLATGVRAGSILLLAALAANIVGATRLSDLLAGAVFDAGYLALLLFAAVRVLGALLAVALRLQPLRYSRMVTGHAVAIERRGKAWLRWVAVALWVWGLMRLLLLAGPVEGALRAWLGRPWQLGKLQFSPADLLAFFLAVAAAVLLSRFVRVLLDEDVYPRVELPRGVPYALSRLLHYMLLLAGFFLAVMAAGLDMSRFALVAGAFGVGIGFGLQNVVNNFVSGLILLFERPVQVGDTIAMTDMVGEVQRIGIRSSTVRTWDGSDVVVPNAEFISQRVTNWTLSDQKRRIEVPVGVAYGTDPERVLELLFEVARSHPNTIDEPAPRSLFLGFGDSSLNFELRAWVGQLDHFLITRSELHVQINAALAQAGITIPFPQRDLHLVGGWPAPGQVRGKDDDSDPRSDTQ